MPTARAHDVPAQRHPGAAFLRHVVPVRPLPQRRPSALTRAHRAARHTAHRLTSRNSPRRHARRGLLAFQTRSRHTSHTATCHRSTLPTTRSIGGGQCHARTVPTQLRPCSVPGCEERQAGRMCALHAGRARRDRNAATAPYRRAAHTDRFRAAVLQLDQAGRPTAPCALCGRPATIADHHPRTRRRLVELGLDPDDPAYGRPLCWPCHSAHTGRTSPGGFAADR